MSNKPPGEEFLETVRTEIKKALTKKLGGVVWTKKEDEILALRVKDIAKIEKRLAKEKNESKKRLLVIQRNTALDHIAILAILKTKLVEEKAKEELKKAIIKIVAKIIKDLVITLLTA
ncbi:MAG: hypothetical protein PHD51_03580 [Patescibacteria group bacterium]|nr:hypothetical protein [Patescibacteria group bacterium]MDD5490945.1 hypothetical protein [Patescibacteria group bacterium]